MANYNFKKDFPVARETEKEVAKILENLFNAEILKFENTNKYDILAKIKGGEYSFELKEDFLCKNTGNVALEFECRGHPSGIQVSKADYYIYKIHTDDGIKFYLYKTSILKKMVEDKKYFRIVNGGDVGSNSMNYLFKYETFVRDGKLLPCTP